MDPMSMMALFGGGAGGEAGAASGGPSAGMGAGTGALGGGALGLLKGFLIDKPREERQRKEAAEIMRWSPWTGMRAGPIVEADPFGAIMQGGSAGASMGQNMDAARSQQDLQGAQADYYKALAAGKGTPGG